MAAAEERMRPESGYQLVQGTKPQSLAYGHTDSPLALACWIAEKFHGWTTPGSLGDPVIPMDALLANVMLYWINGSLSPMWLYLFLGEFTSQPQGTRVSVPASFLLAAQDLSVPPPRSWLEYHQGSRTGDDIPVPRHVRRPPGSDHAGLSHGHTDLPDGWRG